MLPSETRERLGLAPSAEVVLENTPNGVTLHRPTTHLAKIYLEPTSRCNLDCPMCIRRSWEEPQGNMSSHTFRRVLQGLKELDYKPTVVLGGFGEPLFHPDVLEMIARAKEVSQRVEVITNGLLLTEAMTSELIRLELDALWFSVDRFHSGVSGDGATLLPNIERLNYLRRRMSSRVPETGFVFVATKSNVDDLPALLQGGVRYGVSRYMVTNVLPYTSDMCDQTLYRRAVDQVESSASTWAPAIEWPRMDLDQGMLRTLDQLLRSRYNVRLNGAGLNPSEGRCPFISTGAVAVSWDGAVSPCLGLMHSHVSYLYDKPRAVRRYALGNLNDLSLDELWNDPQHRDFRKRVQAFEFPPCSWCRACDKAEANEEDCFGNAFPTCGGCLWAWGVIQCP